MISRASANNTNMISIAVYSLLNFFIRREDPLEPPFVPSFGVLLLLVTVLFWIWRFFYRERVVANAVKFKVVLGSDLTISKYFYRDRVVASSNLRGLLIGAIVSSFPRTSIRHLTTVRLNSSSTTRFGIKIRPLLGSTSSIRRLYRASRNGMLHLGESSSMINYNRNVRNRRTR